MPTLLIDILSIVNSDTQNLELGPPIDMDEYIKDFVKGIKNTESYNPKEKLTMAKLNEAAHILKNNNSFYCE